MANERRLIDQTALIEDIEAAAAHGGMGEVVAGTLKRYVKRQSTADAVEVVRCGDCKYWTQDGNGYMDDEFHCGNPYGIEGYPEQDDFCSRGERKGGQAPQREDV